jgi:hypothetical protein
MFIGQRLIRSKNSPAAHLTGCLYSFQSLTDATVWCKKNRKVLSLLSHDGFEYTIRSSRAKGVRYVDVVVKNVVSASGSKY